MNLEHLKDENVKALFKVLAPEFYPTMGDSWPVYINSLDAEARVHIFTVVHKCLKALGADNWQDKMFLNRDQHEGAEILRRYTRPDND